MSGRGVTCGSRREGRQRRNLCRRARQRSRRINRGLFAGLGELQAFAEDANVDVGLDHLPARLVMARFGFEQREL